MFKYALCVVILLWSSLASAETLDAFLDRAIASDPMLKNIETSASANLTRARGSFTFPALSLSYGIFALPIETRLGPQRQKVRVAQTIPWFGAGRAMNAIPAAAATMSEPKTADRKRYVVREIKRDAWRWWQLKKEIKTLEDHVVLLDGLSKSAQALVEVGRGKKSDVSQIAFDLAKTENAIRAKRSRAKAAKARLQRWVDEPVGDLELEPTPDEIKIDLSPNHPMLSALDVRDEVSRAKIAQQQKRNKPSFVVAADYFEIGEGDSPAPDAGRDALAFSVGVMLPIWSQPQNNEREALEAEVVAREFERETIRRELTAKLAAKTIEIEELSREVRYLRQTTRPLGIAVQQDVTADYESQRASIADVLRAIDLTHHTDLMLMAKTAKREIKIANIEYIAAQSAQEGR